MDMFPGAISSSYLLPPPASITDAGISFGEAFPAFGALGTVGPNAPPCRWSLRLRHTPGQNSGLVNWKKSSEVH